MVWWGAAHLGDVAYKATVCVRATERHEPTVGELDGLVHLARGLHLRPRSAVDRGGEVAVEAIGDYQPLISVRYRRLEKVLAYGVRSWALVG